MQERQRQGIDVDFFVVVDLRGRSPKKDVCVRVCAMTAKKQQHKMFHFVIYLNAPINTTPIQLEKPCPNEIQEEKHEEQMISVPVSYAMATYLGLDFKPYNVYPWLEIRDMLQQVLRTNTFPDFTELRKLIYDERHWPRELYLEIEAMITEIEKETFEFSHLLTTSACGSDLLSVS